MTDSSPASFSLGSYGYNLTHLAREGMFSPLAGYEAIVARIFEILLRKEKSRLHYNPLLLADDELLTWRLLQEIVRRLAVGDAPDPLPSLQVIAPNYTALCGALSINTRETTGKAEEQLAQMVAWPPASTWKPADEVLARFQAFFPAALQSGHQMVLLLTDFHRLIGGEPQPYAVDVAPLLTPALARREIQLLGTSTLAHYRQSIERDAGIGIRIQAVALRSDEEVHAR
jgi:ATP-dependent Clp protease ATP-binding subunit ClpA